ncbi:hypothetical protein EHS25_007064 [Saitozyma podzolica]|uniref:Calcium uniporter protein, mitochondrial n=1 Tax=Saitozyma podzolica TaxID=1890683 RepID=A0A427XPH1_9TREE|nr:hypothetical protein EHS25_007064 [Saitozyma podzolica]
MYTRGVGQLARTTPRLGLAIPLVQPTRSGLLPRPHITPSPSRSRPVPLLVPAPPAPTSSSSSSLYRPRLLRPSPRATHGLPASPFATTLASRAAHCGELTPNDRDAEIQFLALTGQEGDVDSHLRNAEGEEQASARARSEGQSDDGDPGVDEAEMARPSRQEGGPFLEERSRNAGRFQEVSWSPSTDLSDVIKQSCLDERFKIVIKPELAPGDETEAVSSSPPNPNRGPRASGEGKEGHGPGPAGLILEAAIPSFASRTTFLRRRLLDLTKKLDTMTKQKKAIDVAAHKGAQRLAIVALMAGVAYWAAIVRWTFFTDAGWDLMEPVTWATGFATLLSGCAFLISGSTSVITARQRRLYDKHGLDVEKWTEMVADAKSLRREISRIAADYDIEWKGELEHFDDSQPLEGRLPSASPSKSKSKSKSTSNVSDTDSPDKSSNSDSHSGPESGSRNSAITSSSSSSQPKSDDGSMNDRPGHWGGKVKPGTVENERGESIDIDKTIDEADELASQSKEKREKEKAAQRKGEISDTHRRGVVPDTRRGVGSPTALIPSTRDDSVPPVHVMSACDISMPRGRGDLMLLVPFMPCDTNFSQHSSLTAPMRPTPSVPPYSASHRGTTLPAPPRPPPPPRSPSAFCEDHRGRQQLERIAEGRLFPFVRQPIERFGPNRNSFDLAPQLDDLLDLLASVGRRFHDHAPVKQVDGDTVRRPDPLAGPTDDTVVLRPPDRRDAAIRGKDDVRGHGRLERAVEVREAFHVEHVDLGRQRGADEGET